MCTLTSRTRYQLPFVNILKRIVNIHQNHQRNANEYFQKEKERRENVLVLKGRFQALRERNFRGPPESFFFLCVYLPIIPMSRYGLTYVRRRSRESAQHGFPVVVEKGHNRSGSFALLLPLLRATVISISFSFTSFVCSSTALRGKSVRDFF